MVVSVNKYVLWTGKICWVIHFHLYSPNIRLQKGKFSRQLFKKISRTLLALGIFDCIILRCLSSSHPYLSFSKLKITMPQVCRWSVVWTDSFIMVTFCSCANWNVLSNYMCGMWSLKKKSQVSSSLVC